MVKIVPQRIIKLIPDQEEQRALEEVWHSQAPSRESPLDFTARRLGRPAGQKPLAPAEAEERLLELLDWAQWVRLYPRPVQALGAVVRLARDRGLPKGILWLAPGTGAPLDPPDGPPGVAVLRADWAPDAESLAREADQARGTGLLMVLDESTTGFRLAPGGARQFYGLAAEFAIYGPALAGGRELAVLAGVGQAPPRPRRLPGDEALAGLGAVLPRLAKGETAQRAEAWGRALILGLEFFARKAGVEGDITVSGPKALPRLDGKRMWAFIQLAKEEGLALTPLVLADLSRDPAQAPRALWPRLARACARLKVLPQGEKAPSSWPQAYAGVVRAGFEEGT